MEGQGNEIVPFCALGWFDACTIKLYPFRATNFNNTHGKCKLGTLNCRPLESYIFVKDITLHACVIGVLLFCFQMKTDSLHDPSLLSADLETMILCTTHNFTYSEQMGVSL